MADWRGVVEIMDDFAAEFAAAARLTNLLLLLRGVSDDVDDIIRSLIG